MSESSTTTVKTLKTTTKAAKAPTNGKAEKPVKKNGQREQMVKALKAMKKPVTQKVLEAKSGLEHRAAYHHLFHLRKNGHVKSSEVGAEDGMKEVAWELTANGRKL